MKFLQQYMLTGGTLLQCLSETHCGVSLHSMRLGLDQDKCSNCLLSGCHLDFQHNRRQNRLQVEEDQDGRVAHDLVCALKA